MKIKSILLGLTLLVSLSLETLAGNPTIQGGLDQIWQAVNGSGTNWIVVPYYLHAKGLKHPDGGGIGLFYHINDYIVPGIRVEDINNELWMPSGSVTLQLPLHPVSWLGVTIFIFGGVGTPLSGAQLAIPGVGATTIPGKATINAGQAVAITGYGVEVKLYSDASGRRLGGVFDYETWSGVPNKQLRVGITYKGSGKGFLGLQ